MKIIMETKPTQIEIDFLEKKLLKYNSARIPGYSYEDVVIKLINNSNSLIAGLHGTIGGGWFYIASLWVEKKFRKKGYGSKLLSTAKKIGISKKCIGIYLYTYSFQNPSFYERHGFKQFGILDNFCEKESKIFMKKRLCSSS